VRIDGTSTLNLSMIMRSAILKGQKLLSIAQHELATGRHDDIGLVLGGRVASDIGWRGKLGELEQLAGSIKLAGVQAEFTQKSLASASDLASSFRTTLVATRTAEGGRALAREAAGAALESLRDLMNVTYDGRFLFGGINSDTLPMATYAGGLPEASVTGTFSSAFGFTPTDALAATLSPGDIQAFIDNEFAALFQDPAWSMNWSAASSDVLTVRLGLQKTAAPSATANSPAIRHLTEALTMIVSLAGTSLPQPSYETVVETSLSLIGRAENELVEQRAKIGVAQNDIQNALTRMSLSSDIIQKNIATLESVDPYEAATKVNQLSAQLEASYAITGKLNGLSLVKFL